MEQEFDNHIFNIFDDNTDTLEYTKDILNQYFTSGHLQSIIMDEEEEAEINEDNSFMMIIILK